MRQQPPNSDIEYRKENYKLFSFEPYFLFQYFPFFNTTLLLQDFIIAYGKLSKSKITGVNEKQIKILTMIQQSNPPPHPPKSTSLRELEI